MLPHPNKVNIDIKNHKFPLILVVFYYYFTFLTSQFFKDFEKKYKVISIKNEDSQIAFPKKIFPKNIDNVAPVTKDNIILK